MSGVTCAEVRLLIQADVDGELAPADAARLARHLDACPDCAAVPARLAALSRRIRTEAPRYAAPDSLRAALRTQVSVQRPADPGPRRRWAWAGPLSGFGAGLALAAVLMLALLPRPGALSPQDVVADHIRALQPGHLMDVASTDQHTVKPWFDGRLDFAPPVKDLAADGYPLSGGRLDYLGGRAVAALVYHRRAHPIDLFVWPSHETASPAATSINGYNVIAWSRDGMAFRAVSDLEPKELAEFVRLFQAG